MRMYDIIHKKREGGELTREELRFFVQGFTRGEIPDYQASALLMAIFFRGMTRRETGDLTLEMAGSGDRVDLSTLPGVKVDKHSTGGVGDKTSLIIGPIAAACGVTIAKMSGRGLGHTGGTVDKLESIPGLRTDIPRQEFFDIVKRTGLSIIGQQVGRQTVALITDMDMPLGRKIGNALEVQEAVEVLSGKGDHRLRSLCLELSANMVYLGRQAETMEGARAKAVEAVRSGGALEKLRQMTEAQGGDGSYITNPEKFTISPACVEIAAPQAGYITRLDAEGCGLAAVELGAGRETKESPIDFGAGIVLMKNKGDRVEQGQPIARLYAQSEALCRRGEERFFQALEVGPQAPQTGPMILDRVAEG